jgi:ArsR family metal-binding transcriptional regulator
MRYEESLRFARKSAKFAALYGMDADRIRKLYGMNPIQMLIVDDLENAKERRKDMDDNIKEETYSNQIGAVERIAGTIPTLQEIPMAKSINIHPQSYGYLVKVGCQTFAIESASKLIKVLDKYLDDPGKTEKLWLEGKLDLKDM